MATENLKERKIYRILTNASSKVWDKIAFWTTAKSVDAADGNNLETKVGAIKGITTSTNTTTKGYAADATVIKNLNDSLKGFTPIVDSTGRITGYKTKAGADTVFPFSSSTSFTSSTTLDIPNDKSKCIVVIYARSAYNDYFPGAQGCTTTLGTVSALLDNYTDLGRYDGGYSASHFRSRVSVYTISNCAGAKLSISTGATANVQGDYAILY